jgi:hypothetical protein
VFFTAEYAEFAEAGTGVFLDVVLVSGHEFTQDYLLD